jgi:hypothetical protein
MIEALQLCVERKVSNGEITQDLYEAARQRQAGPR